MSGVDIGPEIWRRTVIGPFDGIVREFRERWFCARVPQFELDTRGFDQLERDTITEHRWWALAELDTWHERLVPSDLVARYSATSQRRPSRDSDRHRAMIAIQFISHKSMHNVR